MIEKLKAGWQVMQVGKEVTDPASMKNVQTHGNKIGLLILALIGLAKAFGYDFSSYVDTEAALLIGGGIASIWNIVFTYATSKKVGLPAKGEPDPEPPHINHF